ncbi:MAG: hypothetical protein HZA89_10315 [Verrucomicrobia bacterium]|nr:hypothetical protein [Verrucomicrobiota bacterium]
MKGLSTFAFYVLAALICVLSEGCRCHVTIGPKKSPTNTPAAPPQTENHVKVKANKAFSVKMPGRAVKITSDEDGQIEVGGQEKGLIRFGDQQLKVTKTAILWNGAEVVEFRPEMAAIEVNIVSKNLKITAGKTVLFEAGF